eukprot:728932-Lingulodinium_polyedra.AAC.1
MSLRPVCPYACATNACMCAGPCMRVPPSALVDVRQHARTQVAAHMSLSTVCNVLVCTICVQRPVLRMGMYMCGYFSMHVRT